MIGFLKGTVEFVTEDALLMDVGGVGFELKISTSTASALPSAGSPVTMYTHLAVKEDDMTLYGFLRREELELFKILITVSGVGPKSAQGILGVLTPDDLRFAIMSGDAKSISRAPGVGSRTAQRIILDLKAKIADMDISALDKAAGALEGVSTAGAAQNMRDEAVEALTALGYSATEAYKAVKAADNGEFSDAQALLKEALKRML